MNASDKGLCAIYLITALVALVGTWTQNLLFMAEPGHDSARAFIEACFANRAASSIAIDLLLLGVAAFVFMGVETKRLHIRFYWLYVVGSFVIAISVIFPLFMIARQRRIAATRGPGDRDTDG
jgi:Terpene cyclase DEP1